MWVAHCRFLLFVQVGHFVGAFSAYTVGGFDITLTYAGSGEILGLGPAHFMVSAVELRRLLALEFFLVILGQYKG